MKRARHSNGLAGAVLAVVLHCALSAALIAGDALAQQRPRNGSAPSAVGSRNVVTVAPAVVYRSYPVVVPSYASNSSRADTTLRSAPPARGPYMVGSGQWVPEGAQKEVYAMLAEPGTTMATPAAASGHWDWKRASLADLVELSRRNKAARAADQ